MKILELTNYSAGICGVWQRVKQESIELEKKGHVVKIFSSNAIKDSKDIAKSEDRVGNIEIKRFSFKKLGGESFMWWFNRKAKKEAMNFLPDIIIAHAYRHLHTTQALKLKKELEKQGHKCKVFLVTHAPFIEKNITRTFVQKLVVNFYDRFIGPRVIKKFDKVIAITKWEIPYLLKIGAKREKIVYIPNGIPEEFFKIKQRKPKKSTILFLGRISPIKNLEVLIKAISSLKQITLDIVGPADSNYKKKLQNLIKKLKLEKRVKFHKAVYDLKEKIRLIDTHEIFVLPSKREAMPQALIEAMALGKIVISSKTPGGKEIIQDGKNGFLFEINKENELIEKILFCTQNREKMKKIQLKARKTAEKFKWDVLINKLEALF